MAITYKKILSFLCFSLAFSIMFVQVAEASCRFKAAQVDVRQTRLPLQLDRTMSAGGLTATSMSPVKAGNIVLGHGGGGMQISGTIEINVSGSPDRGYCPKVRRVNIGIQVSPVIKIANHLRPNTCEYNAVMQHEQFHVAVLDRTAQNAAQQIPSMVNAHLQGIFTRITQKNMNPQYMQAQIQAEFARTLSSINDQMSSHMDAQQRGIDNPTEYARVQNSCAFR